MSGLEPMPSGVGSVSSANCATTIFSLLFVTVNSDNQILGLCVVLFLHFTNSFKLALEIRALIISFDNYKEFPGKWFWLSWHSGRFPTPEVPGSIPVIGDIYSFIRCQLFIEKTKIKKKRPRIAHL